MVCWRRGRGRGKEEKLEVYTQRERERGVSVYLCVYSLVLFRI